MKILVINHFHPLDVNAHSYRWDAIRKQFEIEGHEVDYISSPKSSEKSKNTPSKWKNQIDKIKKIYRKIYWPDAYWMWILFYINETFKIKKKYDLVVTYYPCMAPSFAVFFAKKLGLNTLRNTPWIIDYGDPFSTSQSMPPNNYAIYKHLNRKIEKAIFKNANITSFTSDKTLIEYKAEYGEALNAVVIPHIFDDMTIQREEKNKCEHYKICYLGALHSKIREPYKLLEIFKHIHKNSNIDFIIELYGDLNGISDPSDKSNSVFHLGKINHASAIKKMHEADFIINIENKDCSMIPSKIIEMIASCTPIINIGSNQNFTKILIEYEKHGMAININETDSTIESANNIINFISTFKNKEIDYSISKSITAPYSAKFISKQYLDLLKK